MKCIDLTKIGLDSQPVLEMLVFGTDLRGKRINDRIPFPEGLMLGDIQYHTYKYRASIGMTIQGVIVVTPIGTLTSPFTAGRDITRHDTLSIQIPSLTLMR